MNDDAESPVTSRDTEQFKNAHILVADDVAINRILLNAMLSPIVKKVTVVADGKAVLEALEKIPCDIVIMDVQMPNMDGIEATKNIRRHPSHKKIPIIGLTGEDAAERQKLFLAAGMNSILTKPISFERLLDRMRACFGAQN